MVKQALGKGQARVRFPFRAPMKQTERVVVSAVLISKDNKILLGKTREGGVYPDSWHIPGGGVDEGETKESALVREVKEEVGLNIKDLSIKLLSDSDSDEAIKTDRNTGEKVLVKMQFNVYQVSLDEVADDLNISMDDDLRECEWVSLKNLKDYNLTPPSIKLFKRLGWI